MSQFLVALYHPKDYVPSMEDTTMMEEIHALNREMIAAGVRKMACGLSGAALAKSVRLRDGGEVVVTDGPYSEAKEHIGGFWILECAGMDEAVVWAGKGAVACRGPIEVREIFFMPPPE